MRVLFKHAHLIIDDKREYLDGALLINGDKIEDIFANANKIKLKDQDYQTYDVKGLIIMPAFIDIHSDGNMKGVVKSFKTIKAGLDFYNELSKNQDCILEGPFVKPEFSDFTKECCALPNTSLMNEFLKYNQHIRAIILSPGLKKAEQLTDYVKQLGIKVFAGYDENYELNNIDGIAKIFKCTPILNPLKRNLSDAAFNENMYVELDPRNLTDETLKLIVNNISSSRITLCGDVYEGIRRIRKAGKDFTDILKMSSFNASKLFNYQKQYGSLHKGSNADFVFMNSECKIVGTYLKGEITNE